MMLPPADVAVPKCKKQCRPHSRCVHEALLMQPLIGPPGFLTCKYNYSSTSCTTDPCSHCMHAIPSHGASSSNRVHEQAQMCHLAEHVLGCPCSKGAVHLPFWGCLVCQTVAALSHHSRLGLFLRYQVLAASQPFPKDLQSTQRWMCTLPLRQHWKRQQPTSADTLGCLHLPRLGHSHMNAPVSR